MHQTLDEINGVKCVTLKEEHIEPEQRINRNHRHNRKREYKVPEHVKNPMKFTKYDLR